MFVHLLAQAAVAATPEAAAQQGVISYPASFFAAQQPASAFEMLQRLPGFSLDTGDSIRGFEGGGGNALIDGQRPTSKTDNLEEILRRVPAGKVERIDLIRGGAPGIDMQGRSVIANVVRKQGGGVQGVVQGAINHLDDYARTLYGLRVELSGDQGERGWESSARFGFGADDGIGPGEALVVAPDGRILQRARIRAEGDLGNYTLTGAYRQPLLGGKVRLNARHFGEKFKTEQDDRFVTGVEESSDDLTRTFESEVGARYDRAFGPRTNLELIGLHQARDREFSSAFTAPGVRANFGIERETSETIARAVLRYRFDDRLQVEAGAEGALNKLDSLASFSQDGVLQPLPAANVEVEEKRGEIFGKTVWRLRDDLTLEGGVRLERSSISSEKDVVLEKSLSFVKPRAALTWSVTPLTQVRLRAERVVGQLRFDDFVATSNFTGSGVSAGNPNIDPEQAWVFEAELERRFWEDGVVVLTLRRSELSDVIDRGPVFSPNGVFARPTNIGGGRKDEASVNLTLPLDRFWLKEAQLKGEVTWRDSEVRDPTTGRKREISALRPVEWTASYSQDIPRAQLSYGVDAFGGWRETYYNYNYIETVKLRTYVRPWIEWKPQPDWVLRFEIGNASRRGLKRTLAVYPGPRNTNPTPSQIEDREYQAGRMYYIRVRHTFGA